mgnify:CR=1 FL=1
MTIRNQKRPEPRYFAIPHDTMVIVDSSTPGNLAHEPNNTPETLGDAIKQIGRASCRERVSSPV